MTPDDLQPRGVVVYQQSQRWLRAGVFESLAHELARTARGSGWPQRAPSGGGLRQPGAAIFAGK